MKNPHTKKVLFLITKSNWGGAQRYIYDLATNLNPHDYVPVVAVGGNGELVTMLHHAGIRTISVPTLFNTLSPKAALVTLRDIIALCRTEKPDVFHVNSSVAGLLGTLAGRIARVPRVIFTAHGWAYNEDRPWWQKLALKTLHWITILLSHRTIAVSNGLLKEMRWPLAWSRMKVVNPGRTIGVMYDKQEARAELVSFFPQLLPYQNDTWLVCIGELHPIKRHTVLIDAMTDLVQKFPTLRLVCIGEGSERLVLEEKIRHCKLSHNVFLLGALTEAARFLQGFDMFVLASKSESYGYVLHEAGLAHVPVVATNVGGITDIVTHNESGLLVQSNNRQDTTMAITELLEQPEKATRLASTLYKTLKERTVERMVRSTTNLY